jgi:RNA polymerase sigma factor (sigma-70 family)
MIEDAELLRRYAAENAESDFAEFVRRHIDFVYACALRRVGGDPHFAEDVAQQVFIAAARKVKKLAVHPVPTGWLYTATRNIAAQLVRTERRRQRREQEAHAMELNERGNQRGADWEQLRPVIDDALDGLNEQDRQAVLLRFFEGKTFAEIGARLRLAENAARMRVDRALDKLNAALAHRGVASSSAALAVALANQAIVAAPTGLAVAATSAAVAGASVAASGTAGAFYFMGMTKVQVVVIGALTVAGTTGFIAQQKAIIALRHEITNTSQQLQDGARIEAEHRELVAMEHSAAERASASSAELDRLNAQIASTQEQLRKYSSSKPAAPQRRVEAAPNAPVLELKALDQRPKTKFQVPPIYPRSLRVAGMTGEVLVDFVVDADGTVHNAHATRSTHPELENSAIEAVSRWTFEPGMKGGQAVSTHLQMPIVFTFSDEPEAEPPSENSKRQSNQFVPWF